MARVLATIAMVHRCSRPFPMLFGCTLRAPHGGIFVLPIPNAVGNLPMYIVSILAGTVLSALLLNILKKSPSAK
jgi:PTS system fructose-specific IIC component